jgi:hypothetical protein
MSDDVALITFCVVLPLGSLVVFLVGLLWRRAYPGWLLLCAAVPPSVGLAALLLGLPDAGGDVNVFIALSAWFVLCLVVLALVWVRCLRGRRGRRLEFVSLTMPFVAFALVAGFFIVALLTPIEPDSHPAVYRDRGSYEVVADNANKRIAQNAIRSAAGRQAGRVCSCA